MTPAAHERSIIATGSPLGTFATNSLNVGAANAVFTPAFASAALACSARMWFSVAVLRSPSGPISDR